MSPLRLIIRGGGKRSANLRFAEQHPNEPILHRDTRLWSEHLPELNECKRGDCRKAKTTLNCPLECSLRCVLKRSLGGHHIVSLRQKSLDATLERDSAEWFQKLYPG